MRARYARWLPVLVAVAVTVTFFLPCQAQYKDTWSQWNGSWKDSTGCWAGTIRYKFEGKSDGGSKDWTDEEKAVVRAAVEAWRKVLEELRTHLKDKCKKEIEVDLKETAWSSEADITFRWATGKSRDGKPLSPKTAGRITGERDMIEDRIIKPTGVDFNEKPEDGWHTGLKPDGLTKQWDLLTVAMHEIGHILGLKHPGSKEELEKEGIKSIMDTWTTGQRQDITQFDRDALKALYEKHCPCPTRPGPGTPGPGTPGPETPPPSDKEGPEEPPSPPGGGFGWGGEGEIST